MHFAPPLIRGTLLRRYKRFLADVRLECGAEVTAHTANTGTMLGCSDPGSSCWVSTSGNPKRKLRHTLELVGTRGGVLVGINTARTNALAEEALSAGLVPALGSFAKLAREQRFEDSRFDLALDGVMGRTGRTWVEVKNVTLVEDDVAMFPDAVTERGRKHLDALARAVAAGDRAAMLYVVQRQDGARFAPAAHIDPAYAGALAKAREAGVAVHALRVIPTPEALTPVGELPVR